MHENTINKIQIAGKSTDQTLLIKKDWETGQLYKSYMHPHKNRTNKL